MIGAIASMRLSRAAVDELDAAGVGDAGHAHARVVRAVEPGLGLLGEPVDQRADVAPSASGESTSTVPPE